MTREFRRRINLILAIIPLLMALAMVLTPVCVYAEPDQEAEDLEAQRVARMSLPIQSDDYAEWPAGPHIGAEAAIVMDAGTGTILYEKNINEHLYPASVTKMLTALIAVENCDMDEMVTFSEDAINSIDWRTDANLGISAGNSITMEQCLYGLLVGSANEVAYAIAEHVSGEGNIAGFAELMNKRAEELGCTDSHFVTPNGIHDPNHYTSAYDLALIAKAFYSHDNLSTMASTSTYHIPKSDTQPRDDMTVYAKSKLHEGKEYALEGLVGTKTGYTTEARQTLVTCAERNGLRLITVVMKEEAPYQYTDTHELMNYGFDNFTMVNLSENDNTYSIKNPIFYTTSSPFGKSETLIEMDKDAYILIPVNASFEDTESSIVFDNLGEDEYARIDYYLHGIYVGSACIVPTKPASRMFDFYPQTKYRSDYGDESDDVVIELGKILIIVLGITVILWVLFTIQYRIRAKMILKYGRGGRKSVKKSKKLTLKGMK